MVTILIAHYNYQEFLPSAIDSALRQTYPCHICIIDDYSTDQESVKLIANKKFGQLTGESLDKQVEISSYKNATVIYLKTGPNGPSYARNRGIEYLLDQTDIFAVLDADDEMYPTKIEECVKIIQKDPDRIGSVYADHNTLNTITGRLTREYREPFSLDRLKQECIVHSGSVINKVFLEKAKDEFGFYDENLRCAEDWDLWLRIAERSIIVHIPHSLSLVRIQPKNSTDTVSKEIWNKCWARVQQKVQARANVQTRSTNTQT